jgi:hypothetical protein
VSGNVPPPRDPHPAPVPRASALTPLPAPRAMPLPLSRRAPLTALAPPRPSRPHLLRTSPLVSTRSLHREYAYSGAGPASRRTIGRMLWSDPDDKPPRELRDAQAKLRRAGVVIALGMVLAMLVLGLL